MSKVNTKKMVVPIIYGVGVLFVTILAIVLSKTAMKYLEKPDNFNYVVKEIFENTTSVMNETKDESTSKIIKPYTASSVKIGKYYYDYEADKAKQEKSLIYYENTYMQNSGVDYIDENPFDVVSVLNGEVINVKTDKTLGNIVEVKHENDIITIYQGIDNVKVQKNQKIKQGDLIGTSGTSAINPNYKTALHFEVFYKGQLMDPENFYSLNLKDLQ